MTRTDANRIVAESLDDALALIQQIHCIDVTMGNRIALARVLVELRSIGDRTLGLDAQFVSCEGTNTADAIEGIADALRFGARHLGKESASGPMGAIEFLGKEIHDASERLAASLDGIAEALHDHKDQDP